MIVAKLRLARWHFSIGRLLGILSRGEKRLWQSAVGVHHTEQVLDVLILFLGWLRFVLVELGNLFTPNL